MQGYVAAFRDPRVLYAIQSGATQAIAVTMVQWTGPALQIQVLPWTVIQDATTAHAFAAAIVATPRQLFSGGTSISGVIDYAVPLIRESPFQGTRRVIDISGDGSNNRGRPAASARDDAVRAGIVINGLPILALEPSLDRYFSDNVIGGPGAFVIVAESYETFADAILKKLIREMAATEPRPHAGWYAAWPQPGFAGALLQAVHQLAGDWHAGRQNIAGQRFGDVEGLAVGPAEGAVIQVMMVRTVGVHEMGRQHVGVEAPHADTEMADEQAVFHVH